VLSATPGVFFDTFDAVDLPLAVAQRRIHKAYEVVMWKLGIEFSNSSAMCRITYGFLALLGMTNYEDQMNEMF